jgi:hydrogenase expression/formation protein HypC
MCLAIPGKLVAITTAPDNTFRTGMVSFSGIIKKVNLCMVPEAVVNDYVLVHVGVAIGIVDEAEALLTFKYLQQMGEMDELQ